jgi:hypothetical protein
LPKEKDSLSSAKGVDGCEVRSGRKRRQTRRGRCEDNEKTENSSAQQTELSHSHVAERPRAGREVRAE